MNLRQFGSLSPDRMDKECRQNGRRSRLPNFVSGGKVPGIRGKLVHFPLIGRTKNAGRIAVEALFNFVPGESARDSRQIGSLSPEKRTEIAVKPIFPRKCG